jgi:ADP-ribose pyrophosphatase YjhB (NUDIX family)
LSAADYRHIQKSVPIVSIDALPYRIHRGRVQVGLISRDDLVGGSGYAMIGGRILRGEAVAVAVARQLVSTLGEGVSFRSLDVERVPDAIGQYFPDSRPGFPDDPRQHSIGLSWLVAVDGELTPQGEATAFTWFDLSNFPARTTICFRQWLVMEELLALLEPVSLADAAHAITSGIAARARERLRAGESPEAHVGALVVHGHHHRRLLTVADFDGLTLTDLA